MPQLILQPDAAAGIDALVSSGPFANSNFGTFNILSIGVDALSVARSFITFSGLSTIPPGQKIDLSILKLNTLINLGTFTGKIYRVAAAWLEAVLTWNNQPAISDLILSIPSWTEGAGVKKSFDITAAVQNWYDGTWTNDGMRFNIDDEVTVGNNRQVNSSDHATALDRPELITDYSPATPALIPAARVRTIIKG